VVSNQCFLDIELLAVKCRPFYLPRQCTSIKIMEKICPSPLNLGSSDHVCDTNASIKKKNLSLLEYCTVLKLYMGKPSFKTYLHNNL